MILWLALLILAVVYRVSAPFVDWLPNFAPIMAIAYCGAVYTRNRFAVLIPLGALMISDVILNAHYGVPLVRAEMLPVYLCYIAAAGAGLWVGSRKNWLNLFAGALGCSILFYLVTNTAAWYGDAAYGKNFAGWLQALTVGEPGYPPTVYFFRNTLCSDLIFTGFFALCMEWSALRAGRSSLLPFHSARAGAAS